jgi:hypothetical protein
VFSAVTSHVLYSQRLTLFGVNNKGAGFMTCSQKVYLNVDRILVGKPGGKSQLHRPKFRWKGNKFCVKETDCECTVLHSVGSEGYGPTAGCSDMAWNVRLKEKDGNTCWPAKRRQSFS